jgi:hypothetical protein
MKTKLERVFEVVVKIANNKITRWEAAEVAEYLLKKTNGNVEQAKSLATSPYNIGGHITW